MSVYVITNTSSGWTITKNGYSVARRYSTEDAALMVLAFRQCEILANSACNSLITDEMVVHAIAQMMVQS